MAGFVLLGTPHILSVLVTFAVPLIMAALVRRNILPDRLVRYGFASLLILGWAGWYAMFIARGWIGIGNEWPLNLCDWAALALIATLIRPNQFSYDLGYFFGLCGTMHGLFTPPVTHEFPDAEFIFFFVNHGGIIAAVLYLTLGTGFRPVPRSMLRAFWASLIYAAVAGLVDWRWGVNYGLLHNKPPNVSIIDLLSPWPWYIPQLIGIGMLSILFYYSPFYVWDRLAGVRAPKPWFKGSVEQRNRR